MLITSRDNLKVKEIRKLTGRKERDRTRAFFIEGTCMVTQAIEAGADIELLIACPELLDDQSRSIIDQLSGIPCLDVSAKVFETIAQFNNSQGISAVVRQRWEQLENVRLSDELCWIAINSVQCPSNLGALLRISDAVGGRGVILIGNSADPYYPASVRSSLGAIFSQRLVRTDFPEFAQWKQQHGYYIVGTSPAGSVDYQSAAYNPPLVLLLGNEWAGLTEEQESLCDVLVRIPMMGRIESHDVTVAAGIVLYEILNQQRRKFDTDAH